MPSREIRRVRKKAANAETSVDKRKARHPLLYAGSIVVLVIIVVTFVGGPIMSQGAGRRSIEFGRYKGKPIEWIPGNYFYSKQIIIAEQVRQAGETEDLEFQRYEIWRSAFNQTVQHTAIMLEAEAGRIWVSEDRLVKELIKPGPYTVDGKFSEDRYRKTSKTEQSAIRKRLREKIIQEQFLSDIFENHNTSTKETVFFGDMIKVQRKFSFIHYSFSEFPDEEIHTFGEKNKNLFKKIHLSRIFIKSNKNEADEIRNKLDGKTSSFEELARAHSKGLYAEKGGDMGWYFFYDLEGDFDSSEPVEEIFLLKEGELTPVMENRFGWVIYRAESPVIDLDIEDPDSIRIIRDYVMKYEKGMVEDYFFKKADNFAVRARDVGFIIAGLEEGQYPSTTEYFPLNYKDVFAYTPVRSAGEGAAISSASYSEDFFIQAFMLADEQISDPILLDDQVIVLKMDDERIISEEDAALTEDYYRYFTYQSLQKDIKEMLIDSDELEDNFNSVFYQYVYRK